MEDEVFIENHENKISIIEFSKRTRNASTIYSQIRNQDFSNNLVNRHLQNLTKIKSFPSNIFLLDLFQRNVEDKDKIQILKLIETFMLRRHVCEYRTGELDTIFSNLVNVNGNDIVDNVKERLWKFLPGDIEFGEKFTQYSFKNNEGRAKYVIEQL